MKLVCSHVVIAFKLYEAFIFFFLLRKILFLNYDKVINTRRAADKDKILRSLIQKLRRQLSQLHTFPGNYKNRLNIVELLVS